MKVAAGSSNTEAQRSYAWIALRCEPRGAGIWAKTGRYQRGDLWDTRGATYGMPRGRTTTNGQSIVGVSLGHRVWLGEEDL